MKPGEKIYYAISSIEHRSIRRANVFLMFVDEHTKFKQNYFLKTKKELTVCGLKYVDEMEMTKIKIEKFRWDNAGENKKFTEKLLELQKNTITEYFPPGMPKQNGIVGRAFAPFYRRVCAMLTYAKIEGEIRHKLWADCANTATHLKGILIPPNEKKSSSRKYITETQHL